MIDHYENLKIYNEQAEHHFELKKYHERERKKFKKLKEVGKVKYHKEKVKYHKSEMEKYDRLSFNELHNLNINKLYDEQINVESETFKNEKGRKQIKHYGTRAMKAVRYYHYFQHKKASLKEKERWGIELIKMALQRSHNPVVSCSFGIDSIVALYQTRKALKELGRDPSEIQIIWNDTLNEFLDVKLYAKQLVKDWGLNLLITKPKKPLKKVIDEHGGVDSSYFFTRKGDRRNGRPLSEKCCGVLKHEPMKRAIKENNWDLQINGLRADESSQRLRAGLRDGEYFYSSGEWKSYVCRPIMWMTEEDIWDYVEQENIPYNNLYKKNLIKEYPSNNEEIVNTYKIKLIEKGIDINKLKNEQIQNVTRKQAIYLKKIGYDIFTPRTGCQMCPIPVRHSYLQWMRINHPKVYKAMIYNLGYGKALLDMIPNEKKKEIEFVLGIDLNEENADQYLKDILEAKPCVFDSFD